jgi:hypothetical protein
MKKSKRIKTGIIKAALIAASLMAAVSCNNYQNPGNNSGKTGDGTGTDSLRAKKNDTGKGANQLDKLIKQKGDSIN